MTTDDGTTAAKPPANPAREDTSANAAARQKQAHGDVGEGQESGGMKNNNADCNDDVVPAASDASEAAPVTETETLNSVNGAGGGGEGGEGQGGSKRPPRVGSVRQGRKEKRKAGWEAKKALIKAKKRAERERREEAMRKEGLEIPTAGTDYRSLPREQWSVSQRIREAKRQEFEAASKEGGYRVCFDMAFHDLMLEKAQASLVQQLLYAYGSNRKAAQPCRITLSGLGPVMNAKVNKLQGFDTWLGVTTDSRCYTEIFEKEELVYLSADAPHTITQLEKGKVYIIGGLVDRNAHKRVCFKKAEGQGITAARLPLHQQDLHGSHSKVLATNHVFDILLRAMAAGGDLQKIEGKALPPRKRAGWTGGDDRGEASKPFSQQTDGIDQAEEKSEDEPDRNCSKNAERNPEKISDPRGSGALGNVEAMGEGAAENVEYSETIGGVMAAGNAGVEKSGEGQVTVAGEVIEAAAEESRTASEQPVLHGDSGGLDAGRSCGGTSSAGGVKSGEGATTPGRVEGESSDGGKRAAGRSGERSPSSNADSKRRKACTEGDGVA